MSKIITSNKRAYYEYTILEKHIAGLQLFGSEVKSIRNNNVSISESYCFIQDGEAFIKGMHIAEFKESGCHNNHQPLRDRKLLMKKKEISNLFEDLSQKGLTLIPLALIFSNGLVKLEIGLCRGKKLHDKRNAIKEKDIKRDLERNT